ncbi:hypothetical protein BGX34_006229 [Mortierella sp. NVP85]|nr:hypothetical protein BGX34_006229 [Mortierella sp. NVP85]
MDEQHSQEFRARFSSEIIAIPTRYDPKSGQRSIRWKDIHQYFKHAQGVLNGKVAVLFMTSDDFEEQQLEIEGITTLQDQVRQLDQRTQQLQDQIVEILQEAQRTRQQVDDVPEKIQHSEQQIKPQITDLLQRVQQLQLLVNGTDHGNDSPIDQIRKQILQQLQRAVDRQSIIQYRVQTLLGTLPDDLIVPQLFLILPKHSDNEQGRSDSWLFRVHFLCERSPYTMNKGTRKVHDVHMTSHPGYDIKSPEFFDKCGPYALTMMYLIKYGAIASGFSLPPLVQSSLTAKIEESQKRLGFVKENIGQLVDETITYFEDTTRAFDNDTGAASQWNTGPMPLGELKSYLDINESEDFPRGLYQLTVQEGHWSLVCSEHRLEWVIQNLKDIVNSTGGSYTEEKRNTSIKVTSVKTVKRLYSAVLDVFKVQSNSTVPLLTMDCGRLLFKSDVSPEAQNVSMTITRLSDLTSDDLEFIQQCNISQLEIKHTPTESDDDRLTNILHQCVKLKELEIICHCERTLAVIDLVIILREKILQSGRSSALQIFKVADELGPINFYSWTNSEKDRITTTVTFSAESTKFDMDTHAKLQNTELVAEGSQMSNFFRQYGWSISSLNTMIKFNDHLATLLDDSTKIHGSRLSRLTLLPENLTTVGLKAMDRIVKRSLTLNHIWLFISGLHQESQPEKAVHLLDLCGKKLCRLYIMGENIEGWLPQLAKAFPDRSNFPVMSKFEVRCYSKRELPQECVKWLAVMVSTPSSSGTHLDYLRIYNVTIQPQDWETLIKAIDFSMLEDLRFDSTNFSQEQLGVLVDCITATNVTPFPLNNLSLTDTDLLTIADKQTLRERIQKVAPWVSIVGL